MLKKDKNEIFHTLKNSELGLENFDLSEKEIHGLPSIILSYKNTPFEFIIRYTRETFGEYDYQYVRFTPQFNMSEFMPNAGFTSISSVCRGIIIWIEGEIKPYLDELSEPDLWNEFKNGNKTLNINEIDFYNQTNFSSDEKDQVSLAINELKLLIKNNFQTTSEEQLLVNERLDYLISAVNHHNKFDWKSLAISTLISISISLSLDTQKGQELFHLFKKVFSLLPQIING